MAAVSLLSKRRRGDNINENSRVVKANLLPAMRHRLCLAFRSVSQKTEDSILYYARLLPCFAMLFAVTLLTTEPAFARGQPRAEQAASNPKGAAMIVDANSGQILMQDRVDEMRHPASLTKMMTLYLTFDALRAGRLGLQQSLPVSAHAASRAPTNLALRAGQTIKVEDCILGLVTRSANDAASVLAEALGGSEERFAQMMTLKARQLGMTRTRYTNASGLPDVQQVTTARDQAVLGLALQRDFPQYYPYFSTRSFTFRGRTYPNHNRLLASYAGMDGMKTGFVRMSGFNVVTSAKRGGVRLVGVVMGGSSAAARDRRMASLMNQGFAAATIGQSVPRVAQSVDDTSATASVMAQPASYQAVADQADGAVQAEPAVQRQPVVISSANRPTNANAKIVRAEKSAASATVTSARVPKQAKVAKASKSSKASDSWAIQLGAYKTKTTAQKILRVASQHLRQVAPSKRPVVAKINRDGVKLFQVRLTGLDRSDAVDACGILSQQDISCKAVRGSEA
ncbi:MAG: D-alanyl-D-alanine carboxypeptidase family protein [Holosporaceae bacterium]